MDTEACGVRMTTHKRTILTSNHKEAKAKPSVCGGIGLMQTLERGQSAVNTKKFIAASSNGV